MAIDFPCQLFQWQISVVHLNQWAHWNHRAAVDMYQSQMKVVLNDRHYSILQPVSKTRLSKKYKIFSSLKKLQGPTLDYEDWYPAEPYYSVMVGFQLSYIMYRPKHIFTWKSSEWNSAGKASYCVGFDCVSFVRRISLGTPCSQCYFLLYQPRNSTRLNLY